MQNRSSACLAAAVHCKKCRCKKYKYINTPNVNKHKKPVAAIKHDFCGFLWFSPQKWWGNGILFTNECTVFLSEYITSAAFIKLSTGMWSFHK